MDLDWKQRTHQYVQSRRQHPAWQLLAARSAPLVLSCLQTLFEKSHDGIEVEAAEQMLAAILEQHANSDEFGVDPERECAVLARKELRRWIRRSLLTERAGRLYATDALEEALRFVAALDGRLMTSTASRLSIVQREIENLESNRNPDRRSRSRYLQRKIQELERELEDVRARNVRAMTESEAIEGIREIYNLATSLRADFRRVEDSDREADQALRQSIVSERGHRLSFDIRALLQRSLNEPHGPNGSTNSGRSRGLRCALREPDSPSAAQTNWRFLHRRLKHLRRHPPSKVRCQIGKYCISNPLVDKEFFVIYNGTSCAGSGGNG
ncbi:DUF3375 family protein [Trinickia soli]|uniref:DUF3375 family protein n=1 Tax=Trinickia soli TaxID=380675 RepID=UPI002AA53DD5